MLFLSNELRFPSKGGGSGGYRPSDLVLGAYSLLKSSFSWRQAEMLWAVTLRKYARAKEFGGGKA